VFGQYMGAPISTPTLWNYTLCGQYPGWTLNMNKQQIEMAHVATKAEMAMFDSDNKGKRGTCLQTDYSC